MQEERKERLIGEDVRRDDSTMIYSLDMKGNGVSAKLDKTTEINHLVFLSNRSRKGSQFPLRYY
jgi:hypothetical protein